MWPCGQPAGSEKLPVLSGSQHSEGDSSTRQFLGEALLVDGIRYSDLYEARVVASSHASRVEPITQGCTNLPLKATGPIPRGPISSRGWSIPEFLRKPIGTCDFPVGGRGGPRSLDPPKPIHCYHLKRTLKEILMIQLFLCFIP